MLLETEPPAQMPTRSPRPRPPASRRTYLRRRVLVLALVVLGAVLAYGLVGALGRPAARPSGGPRPGAKGGTTLPDAAGLSPLRARIVELAESQLGYRTDPPTTYCNRYSAYWYSGQADCGNANLDEEWCADFAAWVWQKAGAYVEYQYINGDLNSSAASFYEWGAAHGTWHALGTGYLPVPGDVAVYGLNRKALVAAHVAVVVGYQRGDRGPDAVNGDGDLTGFSVVELRRDEYVADTHPAGAPLSGYVSPTPS